MKQVMIRRGRAVVADVPAPSVGDGEILVNVRVSCISTGTESTSVRASAVPIWKRALRQPENVAKTVRLAREQGIRRTWEQIEETRNRESVTGYSAAGVVIAVGPKVDDIVPGDRVACAGGYANHSEYIRVPRNLCVPIPDNLDWESAATVALGAIALQGVRRAQPTLGESFVVIGLGFLGQITVQLLRAHGARTIGVELDEGRIAIANRLGMDAAVRPDTDDQVEQVQKITNRLGADGVIITAATPSDAVVSAAFQMTRRKGRVVIVGDVGLNLNRADFYTKEIDFLISTSYGPGRYDPRYEEQGLDYPVGFVRWTENRNMTEYLRLLAEKHVTVEPLIAGRYTVEEAEAAYASLSGSETEKPLVVLLSYSPQEDEPPRTIKLQPTAPRKTGVIQVAVVGAGAFAQAVHLPNLRSLNDRFALHSVVSRSGSTAATVAKQYGAENASTDFHAVLEDPDVDAVIIATRHHLHGEMALAALQAGKHVLVEKPLVLNPEELAAIDAFVMRDEEREMPVLLTGYNRRFSPYARAMANLLEGRSAPFILNYRMNAGYIPADHWVHGPEGGGRNLGEACHIYDLFVFLSGADCASVSAHAIDTHSASYGRTDNFVVTTTLADGSVASLTYTALGSGDYAKETADLYVDGNVAVLDDYKQLVVYGPRAQTIRTGSQDKGHKGELVCFANSINSGQWPIPWSQQYQTAALAISVDQELRSK